MKHRIIKVYETIVTVEGSGDFPFDMLRHDACMPKSENDAHLMNSSHQEKRTVQLIRRSKSDHGVNARRWESFTWRVVSEEVDF